MHLQAHPLYDSSRVTAFPCDITQQEVTSSVPAGSVDVATLIFVLSAIHPDNMVGAVRNVAQVWCPCLLIKC